jgi:hypothetical protein
MEKIKANKIIDALIVLFIISNILRQTLNLFV